MTVINENSLLKNKKRWIETGRKQYLNPKFENSINTAF
jgi:hypothetical protein